MEDISSMYALDQPEIKLKNYMYKTVYTLSALRRTLFCDKLDFMRENSRLLKSIYPSNEGTCRNVWQNRNSDLPGSEETTSNNNMSIREKI